MSNIIFNYNQNNNNYNHYTNTYNFPTGSTLNISGAFTNPPNPSDISLNDLKYVISNNSINNTLPRNLILDPSNGNISGPTTFFNIIKNKSYIIAIIDNNNEDNIIGLSNTINITIDYIPEFHYLNNITNYQEQINSVVEIKPYYTIYNKYDITYTLTSNDPLENIGLKLDKNTGQIDGTIKFNDPTQTSQTSNVFYTITANNNGILYDNIINIIINVLPIIVYPEYNEFIQNNLISITPLSGTIFSSDTFFSLNCNLPNGLTLNTKTGDIYGSVSLPMPMQTYIIYAENNVGRVNFKIKINIIKDLNIVPVVGDNFSSNTFLTSPDIEMRRKAEIFKYKKNSNNLTKNQYYSLLSKGKSSYAKRAFSTQSHSYTNSSVNNLQQINNTLICDSSINIICRPSSSSNVPGPVITLCYNPNIDVIGYKEPNKKRTNIGLKYPYRGGN